MNALTARLAMAGRVPSTALLLPPFLDRTVIETSALLTETDRMMAKPRESKLQGVTLQLFEVQCYQGTLQRWQGCDCRLLYTTRDA